MYRTRRSARCPLATVGSRTGRWKADQMRSRRCELISPWLRKISSNASMSFIQMNVRGVERSLRTSCLWIDSISLVVKRWMNPSFLDVDLESTFQIPTNTCETEFWSNRCLIFIVQQTWMFAGENDFLVNHIYSIAVHFQRWRHDEFAFDFLANDDQSVSDLS